MNRTIRVDTDDLKKKALRLLEISDIFSDLGNRVRGDCLSVPSYDNQLLGPAQTAAMQVSYETGAMRDAYQWSGEFMATVAGQFEKADKNSIESFTREFMGNLIIEINFLKYSLLGIEPMEGDIDNGYQQVLAYEEDGNSLTIWYDGRPMSINLSDPSLTTEEREQLKAKLDKFRESMRNFLEHVRVFSRDHVTLFWAALSMVGSAKSFADLRPLLASFGLSGLQTKALEDEWKKAIKEYTEAVDIWQELNSSDVPGKVPEP